MSTRASIRIVEAAGQILLYHHHDGYPEGVGAELKKFLAENVRGWWDPEAIASGLATMKNDYGRYPYECAICLHGDEEYVYVIDCEKKTLTCYYHRWDETFDECCIPERICEIP